MIAKLTILKGFLLTFLFVATLSALAQKKVEGKVTGPDGKPVFGATVLVKGTNTATSTSNDGSYSITLPPNGTVLVFSYVGYDSYEVNVSGKTTANVELKLQSSSLNEVVVIGYGTQKRKDVTGAISSVTSSQIEKVPVSTLDQAMQGRAAGVQVINNDASPGGNVSVLIRGVGSIAPGGNYM